MILIKPILWSWPYKNKLWIYLPTKPDVKLIASIPQPLVLKPPLPLLGHGKMYFHVDLVWFNMWPIWCVWLCFRVLNCHVGSQLLLKNFSIRMAQFPCIYLVLSWSLHNLWEETNVASCCDEIYLEGWVLNSQSISTFLFNGQSIISIIS